MAGEEVLDQMPSNFSRVFLLEEGSNIIDDINSIIYCDNLIEKETLTQNKNQNNLIDTDTSIIKSIEASNIIEDNVVDDLSTHVYLLTQKLTADGQWAPNYFCPSCEKDYMSVKEFLLEHPGVLITESLDKTLSLEDLCIQDEKNYLSYIEFDESEVVAQENNEVCDKNEEESTIIFDPMTMETYDEGLFFCSSCQQVYNEIGSHDFCSKKDNCNSAQNKEEKNALENEQKNLESMKCFCAHCNEIFTSTEDRVKHAGKCLNQEKPNVFYCPICDNEYINIRSFKIHVRKCGESKKKSPLKRKETIPKQSEEVFCNICNTTFLKEKHLKMHMRIHDKRDNKSIQEALPAGAQDEYKDVEKFYCEICDKSFDQNLLSVHKNMHLNVGDRNCSKCNRVFENDDRYRIHLQMHIQNSKKSVNVKNTNTECSIEDQLKADSTDVPKQENGSKSFLCQFCGKEFTRPYLKVKHERIHTGEKPYECEVCGKTFRVSYSLTLHLRTHTDIRPYVCTICDKRFKSHSTYVHHLNTHNSERPYKCDQCDKSFRTSVQLYCHKNGHTKPFNCNICSRTFRSMTAVRSHMETHQKQKIKCTCKICGANYERMNALRIHCKQQHSLQLNSKEIKLKKKKDHLQNEQNSNSKPCQDVKLNSENYGMEKNVLNDIQEITAATQSIIQNDGYFFMNELNIDELI